MDFKKWLANLKEETFKREENQADNGDYEYANQLKHQGEGLKEVLDEISKLGF